MSKIGLVLEGGSLRGLYSAGVLDIMMDNNIEIDTIVGTSAGALFGPNYFSKQRGRAIRYNKKYCKDRRNISMISWLFTGNVVNKKFAYYKITQKLDKFDNETFIKSNKELYVTATNMKTAECEYFKINDVIKDMEKLRATSAIPIMTKPVKIGKNYYLDGGISDSIPIKKCEELNCDKIIVVLTQPDSYKKVILSNKKLRLIKILFKKYPKLIKRIENRHNEYNECVDYIRQLERENKIFVIRPNKILDIDLIERDQNKLERIYQMGVKDMKNQIDELKKYLERK